MNTIQTLTSAPWIVRLGWTLLHFLWQGTAIAILYAAIRFLFARTFSASARYTLACVALLAMAISPLLTYFTISGQLSRVPVPTLTLTEWKWLPPIAVAFWVNGVFWFSVRLLSAVMFTRRLRKSAHPAPDAWQQTLNRIAVGRHLRHVRLMTSSMVNAPAVIGYLRPVVLVPVTFFTGLPADHIMALLTHEMAHICRRDYLVCMLQSFVEVALFYHPAVWWISSQLRIERELCCDDLVIAAGTDRLTYARALTDMESARPQRLMPSLAANGGSLMDRIRRLIEPSWVGSHHLPGAGAAWAMILLLFVGAGVVPVHGAQKSAPSHPAQPAVPSLANPQPSASPLDSLLGAAQKTLLYDPVLSAQLLQPRPMPTLPPAAQATNRAGQNTATIVEPVTVRTASDTSIDGLRAEDFTLTEDGNPQRISVFEYQNVDRQANRRLALYFDMTSMPTSDQLRALDAAQKFISTQMSQTDAISLIRYTTAGVEILQDFTGDRGKLFSVIAAMTTAAAGSPGPVPSEKLGALRTVIQKLGALNEKKSLVYFSSLNLSPMDNQAELRVTINDAVRAGVSIWPVTNDDALNTLATDTGGKPAANSGDLAASIFAAEKSITSYYLIGYTSTNQTPDGKYRHINIALNNNTDAKLDYRKGYYARRDSGAANTGTPDDRERQLQDAFLSEDPVMDLALAAEVNYFRVNKAESFVPVTVKIPGGELNSATNNGADRPELELIAEVKDELGTIIQRLRDRMEIRQSDSPAIWNAGVLLLPGTYSIKILARDGGTGRMGTFLGKFTVQNLNKETQMPISSVVLSSQFADDAPSTVRAVVPVLAPNPLIHDGKRMIPSVTRVFSAKDDMYVYLQAFEQGAKTAAPLTARVAFYKGSAKILETPPVTVSEGLDLKSSMLPITMNVALSSLKPGEYDCQVTVLDPASQKSALWQKPVTIVP